MSKSENWKRPDGLYQWCKLLFKLIFMGALLIATALSVVGLVVILIISIWKLLVTLIALVLSFFVGFAFFDALQIDPLEKHKQLSGKNLEEARGIFKELNDE